MQGKDGFLLLLAHPQGAPFTPQSLGRAAQVHHQADTVLFLVRWEREHSSL